MKTEPAPELLGRHLIKSLFFACSMRVEKISTVLLQDYVFKNNKKVEVVRILDGIGVIYGWLKLK